MSSGSFPSLHGEVPLVLAQHGQKSTLLQRAAQLGELVPAGFAIDAETAVRIAAGEHLSVAQLAGRLSALAAELSPNARLAVRSSPSLSVPGALRSELDVPCEAEAVRAAVERVLSSRELANVAEHLAAQGRTEPTAAWLGVLVQHYVAPRSPQDLGFVLWSHDPQTGEPRVSGEFAQGGVGSVVSGRTRPRPLSQLSQTSGLPQLGHAPALFEQLHGLAERLSAAFDEPLELEVAYVAGELRVVQVRPLGLSPKALVRVALAAIEDDSPRFARWLCALAEQNLGAFVETHLQPTANHEPILRGLAASMGAAVGVVVTDVERARERAAHDPVVLLRPDAVPEDVAAFRVSKAVVTTSGGLTCHAAVIARGLKVPAIVGCQNARIDLNARTLWGGRNGAQALVREGEWVSVDARRGLVYKGQLAVEQRLADGELRKLFAEVRKLRPTPLWVHGDPDHALAIKEDASLDGALCPLPQQGVLPPGRGRECWVEIDAAAASDVLPRLPPGWGVVLSGAPYEGQLAALRQQAPLRAFGVRVDTREQLLAAPRERLEILVLGAAFQMAATPESSDPQGLSALDAARVLRLVTFSADLAVLPGHNVGWICPAAHAAQAALRYAAARTKPRPVTP